MKQRITEWLKEHKSITLPAWLKRNPDILVYINDQTLSIPDIKNVMERVYIVLNGDPAYCEFGNKRQFNTFDLGYRKGCVHGNKCRCVDKHRIQNQKTTLMNRYGVTSVSTIPLVGDKRKRTMKARYGVEYAAQADHVKMMKKEINSKRTSEEKAAIVDKRRETTLKRFGVEHHMKSSTQQQKVRQTNQDRYGVEFPLQRESSIQKLKESIRNKDWSLRTIKIKKTMLDHHGVEHVFHRNLPVETLHILKNPDEFKKFIIGKTRDEAKNILHIHEHCLYLYAKRYECQDLFSKPEISKLEQEIVDFISTMTDDELIQSDRTIISPKELDIYIPRLKTAIEVCGLYWHSENSSNRGRNYHSSKMQRCKKLGIKLITIYEDEWNFKQDKVKKRLRHILNKSTDKVYARNCKVREITSSESKIFVEHNHMQGHTSAGIHIGLFYNDLLVSVMTFKKSRYNSKYEYELIRLCSTHAVVGGASKLWKYFLNFYSPNSVISYSDNRWGHGEVYPMMGFEFLSETVGYEYTDYRHRFNRLRFQKHKLVNEGYDPALSEWQIMQSQGYDRIWDCGQTTWVWNKHINNKKV